MSDSKTTTSHQEIKLWVEQRGGQPAVVKGTEENETAEGMLRIRFSDESSDDLKAIGWDKFFKTFEEKSLLSCIRIKPKKIKKAVFFKFVTH